MGPFPGKGLACVLVILGLLLPPGGGKPALAANDGDPSTVAGAVLGGFVAVAAAYGMWRNRPSQQDKKEPGLFPGEFYVAGYLGGSLVPNTDLKFNNGIFPAGGGRVTAKNQRFEPAVVGGLKFGYFLKSVPYLGLEAETNYAHNNVREQRVSLSRPVQGSTQAILRTDDWSTWTMALHIVGRYGFFPDQEVPFGRLQPYVGIGPGFVVIYDEVDAAKNFAVDVMAGLRYMMLKNVSAFVEYKYSHQWDVELESHEIIPVGGTVQRGKATFDYDSHRIVLGVAYHF
jgi:opacity protein-like surface antigen